jgi:3-oxoacyl-[acyl-carrier protein] reductase
VLLEGKTAVIYGGGGAIGGAVARAFAREGASVNLAGRTLESLERVAEAIRSAEGAVETTQLDAPDEEAVDEHADALAASAGAIDISFNLISLGDVHGTPLTQMALEDYERPIRIAVRTQFLTTRAAARHMIRQGSGVILFFGGGGGRDPIRDYCIGGFRSLRSISGGARHRGVQCESAPPGGDPDRTGRISPDRSCVRSETG